MNSIVGMLRVKNESRWIARVIESIQDVCQHICILDDGSTDETVDICESMHVDVWQSPFQGLDEVRDKDFLLGIALSYSPDWILHIDGDEVLEPGSESAIHAAIESNAFPFYRFQILYFWAPDQIRVDGIYSRFRRGSLFSAAETKSGFRATIHGNGANLHCSNVPSNMLALQGGECSARLLHYGYYTREERLRKYKWYNSIDPGNVVEDAYRHMVIGDLPELPPETVLHHAGPLKLQTYSRSEQVCPEQFTK